MRSKALLPYVSCFPVPGLLLLLLLLLLMMMMMTKLLLRMRRIFHRHCHRREKTRARFPPHAFGATESCP